MNPVAPGHPTNTSGPIVRLADFIRNRADDIIMEWINFAQTRNPASAGMTRLALKDHIGEILQFVAQDLESHQTQQEQIDKSRGEAAAGPILRSAAEVHAALRHSDGFNIDQMVSEYRALRASIVKLWMAANSAESGALRTLDVEDLIRFNEAIDQAMSESIAEYTLLMERSRNLFIGIIGHDLRNPIGAAAMAAQALVRIAEPGTKQHLLASQIVTTVGRGIRILDDLVDVTRSSFGGELSVSGTRMDLGKLAVQIVDESQALAEGRTITLDVSGNTSGVWDRGRLGQLLSNLLGNAIAYSFPDSTIEVSIAGAEDKISLSVHNDGDPIPPSKREFIFEHMTRGAETERQSGSATHLGLGLFIARKIVSAHGGTIRVASSMQAGTTFTVDLPRH